MSVSSTQACLQPGANYAFNPTGFGGNINSRRVDESAIMFSRPEVATNGRPMLFADNAEEFVRNPDFSFATRQATNARTGMEFRDGGAGVVPLITPWQRADWRPLYFTEMPRLMTKSCIEQANSHCAAGSTCADVGQRAFHAQRDQMERGGANGRVMPEGQGWAQASRWNDRVASDDRVFATRRGGYRGVPIRARRNW